MRPGPALARGFTLVELMVVLAVIAVAGTAVLLTQPGDQQRLSREAERFGARLVRAQEEAILGTRSIQVVASEQGYAFARQRFAQWEPLVERPFGDVAWEQGTLPRLTRDLPEVRFDFDPSGIASPAALVLTRGHSTMQVSVDAEGKVTVDAPRG